MEQYHQQERKKEYWVPQWSKDGIGTTNSRRGRSGITASFFLYDPNFHPRTRRNSVFIFAALETLEQFLEIVFSKVYHTDPRL